MIKAENAFESTNYDKCLQYVGAAEGYGSISQVVDAEILFYKAMCLERSGQINSSQEALERLSVHYPGTDWAAAASRKLKKDQDKVLRRPMTQEPNP